MANIVCDDKGTYRWVYEFNMFTNPTILITLFKIFIGIGIGFFLFMLILLIPDLVNGYAGLNDVWNTFVFNISMLGILLALILVGYLVYAAVIGGKYCVLFTMDETGIEHKQLDKQYKKAQVISALNVVMGVASGNPTQTGIGILSTRNSMSSDFSVVRSIKGSRLLRVIKVNAPLSKNQVYVDPEDYDFVFNYIVSHCPNAKKVRG